MYMFRTLLISLCLTSTALATTWTVDDDGKADFDNIQAAVDASSDGDEIIVASGVYSSTNNNVVNMLGKEIWLHSSGGAEVTIIDGEDTRRGVLCNSGETNKTIIEGFTITSGFADRGGGMCIDNADDATLKNCIFSSNLAVLDGGGVYCNGFATFDNCIFTDNLAFDNGGGLLSEIIGSVVLTECSFLNNTASNGAGIYIEGPEIFGDTSLNNCYFLGNIAYGSGGGLYTIDAEPQLLGCTFDTNSALGLIENYGRGGGIYCENNNPLISNCTFENNTAEKGGGIYHYNVDIDPTLKFCTFENNGGDGHAVQLEYGSGYTFLNCSFNSNLSGGVRGSACIFEDCSFDNNGGRAVEGNNCTFEMCTFNDNVTAVDVNGGIFGDCRFENNNTAVFGGGGSIFVDCRFENNNTAVLTGSGNTYERCTFDDSTGRAVYSGGAFANCSFNNNAGGAVEGFGTFDDCSFNNNSGGAVYGGGTFENCSFISNSSTGNGGACAYSGCFFSMTFSNCTFENNSAGKGGAIYMMANDCPPGYPHSLEMSNCTLDFNSASTIGGAIFIDGYGGNTNGVWLISRFDDCSFTGNTAGSGSVVYSNGGTNTTARCDLTNCTFSDNIAISPSGGAVNKYSTKLDVINCIFENNTSGEDSGAIHSTDMDPSFTNVEHSRFCGNSPVHINAPWTDLGWNLFWNICNDCNGNGIDDYQDILDGTSLDCDNDLLPDECQYDQNGDGIPDVCQCLGDITGDDFVDVSDILLIIQHWGSSSSFGDVNNDGIVDVLDLLIAVGNWGPCE